MNQRTLTTATIFVLLLYNVYIGISKLRKSYDLRIANEVAAELICQRDSVINENHKLRMQVYDLKDSIFTLKYGK